MLGVDRGIWGSIQSLTLGNMLGSEVSDPFKVGCNLVIKKSDLSKPVFKDCDGCEAFFVCRSETSDFVCEVGGHIGFKFGAKCSGVET